MSATFPTPATPPPPPELSVVIPAYNEARRLPRTLAALREFAARQPCPVELLVVDDGSTDGTAGVAAARGARVLRHAPNRGKGYALRRGIAAATGRYVLLCDADLSTPLTELARLRAALAAGADIAIASRDAPGAALDPPQPALRRLLAQGFRAVRRRLLLPAIRDTQCGFKLLPTALAQALAGEVTEDGWLWDVELLARAERRGLRIAEVAVRWRNDRDSRVRVLPLLLKAVPRLLAIRRRVRAAPPLSPPSADRG